MKDGLLSIDVENAELKTVFAEISRRSGIPIVLDDGVAGRVTIRLMSVTPEEVLKQLAENYAFVYERLPDADAYRIIRAVAPSGGHAGAGNTVLPMPADGPTAAVVGSTAETHSAKTITRTGKGADKVPGERLDRQGRLRYRPGELLIKLKSDTPEDKIEALHRSLGSTVLSRMDRLGLQRIKLKKGLRESDAIAQYSASDLVEIAEKHALRYTNEVTPDDPYFGQQWGLPTIRAPEAWDYDHSITGPVIAVIDTGVDYLHPDLKDSIWLNEAEAEGEAGKDDDENGYVDDLYGWDFAGPNQLATDDGDADPMDIRGHGTHVAGIIGARGNNGKGVAGVSWTTRIMALKIQADNGFEMESWDVIDAIDYAIDNGARVVNCSFGGEEHSLIEEQAFARLMTAVPGVLAVCAAGNDGLDIDADPQYPAGFPLDNILSVAAGNQGDALAGFSNYGLAGVDVMAPGVQIKSTIVGGTYTEAFLSVETAGATDDFVAIGMQFSGTTGQDGISGSIYDCGRGYTGEFPSEVEGHVALIQRGNDPGQPSFYFYEKVANAQAAGAIAAVIYNHQPGPFNGTLGSAGSWIPVVTISKEDGETVLGLLDQSPVVTLYNRSDDTLLYYTSKDGTSMAAPFVAGVAGLMLARGPSLSYEKVKSVILDTVDRLPDLEDLIASGGRVNAFSALCSANTLLGDFTCDSLIRLDDALLALQLIGGLTPHVCPACLPPGVDVNDDGRIGVEDAVYILQQLSILEY